MKLSIAIMVKPYVAKVGESLGNGWSFMTSLSLFIINCWPLLILVSMIYWVWRRRRRRLIAEEAI